MAAAALGAAVPAAGEGPQGFDTGALIEVPPQILTIDQERLFTDSAFGRRVGDEIETRSRALAAENRRLESELEAEELALTEARPGLPPDEFRARADAFDSRVQQIRADQDAKARALGTFRDSEQQRFLGALGPVIAGLVRERGALVVIDRRALVISADAIDITDEAIAAVDAAIGDGRSTPATDGPAPAPSPVPAPETPSPTPAAPDPSPVPPPGPTGG